MALVKKESANKKNLRQLQLKEDGKVVEVQQEDNDNEVMDNSDEGEEDHDFESDMDKELDSDLEKDDDEGNDYENNNGKDDNDEGNDDKNDDDEGDDDENDNDEEKNDDMDEDFLKKELVTLQKGTKQVKVEEKEKVAANEKTAICLNKVDVPNNKRERDTDNKRLFVGKLPDGVTEQDLRDLSKDIVEVRFPKRKRNVNSRFAHITFNDEATAETNYNILQTKKIKGQPLTIDYLGRKSSIFLRKECPRTLYVSDLPEDITKQELRSLSEDIVEIDIKLNRKQKTIAFLRFDSEAKAESNYAILKNPKIRGQHLLRIGYKGAYSEQNSVKELSVSGLPLDVTVEQVAIHFKKAFQITLNRSNLFRTAIVSFDTEEDAKEANNAAKDATISEYKLITVLCENSEKRPERGGPFRGGPFRGGPFRGGSFRGGQFRGGSFGGGRNNWGKRSHHNGNFPDGQRFAKKMRK